jgi:hypothetical protein
MRPLAIQETLVGDDAVGRLRIARRRTLRHRMLLHRPDGLMGYNGVSADRKAGEQDGSE